MKALIIIIALLNCLTAFGQEFILNPEISKVEWIGYAEVGNFKQEGTIKAKNGYLILENGMIKSAEVTIDMNTIDHPEKSLVQHLAKKDFFWSKKYPTAQLFLTSVKDDKAAADLTIRGRTHPIRFPIQYEKRGASIVIKGTITMDRTLYDIKYNSSSYFQDLGNYAIKNEFDLSFKVVFE